MSVNINPDTTSVNITAASNTVTIVDAANNVNVTTSQPVTQVVTVAIPGPQGATGAIPSTGSFSTTGSNSFIGNQVITGSLIVSGSSTFTNIGPTILSGSVVSTQGFTGSFIGEGSGLYNIPASGIIGLNLSQISSGSVSASISPDNGLQVNTNITAPSFTGSLFGTASFASTASFVDISASLGFTPENVANKSTNTSLGTSDTLYPTQNAVKVYADSKVTDAIVDGVTTVAPSQNAVFDALDLKQNTLTNPITGTGSNGQVAFFNGTTTQTGDNGLFWDNTNKRLGIGGGAIAPQNNLQVYGSNGTFALRVGQNTSNTDGSSTGISFFNSTTVGGGNTATGQANIRVYRFSGGLGGEMEFNLGSTTLMRLVKEGNVAIGSTTAGARLDVRAQGALSTDIAFRVRNSDDTANLIQVNGAGGIEINSTTQGFLPPRMTTTQRNAIATPAAGLIVYDTTDNKHYGYNGTTWNAFY